MVADDLIREAANEYGDDAFEDSSRPRRRKSWMAAAIGVAAVATVLWAATSFRGTSAAPQPVIHESAAGALAPSAAVNVAQLAPGTPAPAGPSAPPVAIPSAPAAPPSATPPAPPPEEDYASLLKQARRLFRRGSVQQAQKLAERALALNEAGDGAMVVLGNCRLDGSNAAEALKWADKALSRNPRNADAHLLKGSILQQKSRNAEAKQDYLRYLELAPHGEYASEVRAIVEGL
jgi:tetratricopeptide (TPR) repeat protein